MAVISLKSLKDSPGLNVRFCLGEDLLLWLDSVVKRSVAAP